MIHKVIYQKHIIDVSAQLYAVNNFLRLVLRQGVQNNIFKDLAQGARPARSKNCQVKRLYFTVYCM
jgi:hypothetical protein